MDPLHVPLVAQCRAALANPAPTSFGFAHGHVGRTLAACELARLDPETSAVAYLAEAVDVFNTAGAVPGLHHGLAGLGLVVATYFPDAEELLVTIDESIASHLDDLVPSSLRDGLAGIAIYASARSAVASGRALQEAVLQRLISSATRIGERALWHVPRRYAEGRGVTVRAEPIAEAGMAHGMGAVLVALAALSKAGHSEAVPLARHALAGLWSLAEAPPNRFGWIIFGNTDRELINPGTWCAGDPGALRAAWLAADACGDEASAARALTFAQEQARQWFTTFAPARLEQRIDLCCGSAAVGQIFRRFAMETGDALFATTSEAIFAQCEAALPSLTTRGFQFGREGVLTALLSAASRSDPCWDAMLGMSLPSASA